MKNTFYLSQDQFFCWNLTWRNLKGLVELAYLPVVESKSKSYIKVLLMLIGMMNVKIEMLSAEWPVATW